MTSQAIKAATICAFLFGGLAAPSAFADPVKIDVPTGPKKSVQGQGFSVRKGADCLIVTPSHVVQNHSGSPSIMVSDAKGARAAVDTVISEIAIPEVENDGLTVMRLKPVAEFSCDSAWPDGSGAADKARASSSLKIEKVKTGGGYANVRALFRESTTGLLKLEPRARDVDQLAEMDSGSSVYDESGKLVGMILSVDPATKISTAVRQDHANALLRSVMINDSLRQLYVFPLLMGRRIADRSDVLALVNALRSGNHTTVELAAPARPPVWPLQIADLTLPNKTGLVVGANVLTITVSRRENPAYAQAMQNARQSREFAGALRKQLGVDLSGALAAPGKPTVARFIADYTVSIEAALLSGDGRNAYSHTGRRTIALLEDQPRNVLQSIAIERALRLELPNLLAQAGLQ